MSETGSPDIKLTSEQVRPIAIDLHAYLVGLVVDLKSQYPFTNGGSNGYTHFESEKDPESFIATTREVGEESDAITVTIKYPTPDDITSHTAQKLTVTVGKKPSISHEEWDTHIDGDQSQKGEETKVSDHPSVSDKAAEFKAIASEFGISW